MPVVSTRRSWTAPSPTGTASRPSTSSTEDDIGSDEASAAPEPGDRLVHFIRKTGVHVFAPATSATRYGQHTSAPSSHHQRVTDLVEATDIPMALHGGTAACPTTSSVDHIARRCAKVEHHPRRSRRPTCGSGLEHLKEAEDKNTRDPPDVVRPTSAPPSSATARRAHRAVRRLGSGLAHSHPEDHLHQLGIQVGACSGRPMCGACLSSQLGSAAGGAVDAPRWPEPAIPTVPAAHRPTAR